MPQPRETVAHDLSRKEARDKKREATSNTTDDPKLDKKPASEHRPHGQRAASLGVAAAAAGSLSGAVGKAPPPSPRVLPEFDEEAAEIRFVTSDQWDIEPTKNEQVDFFVDFLRLENRDKTKLWLERLGYYGPMIHQKLAERGMPKDLIWLATIESGLDPNAYSRADAAGLWQFIAETGKRHGLEVSEYVDERRDPVAATDAALDYLKQLNDRFGGSWYLAAAGYNTGENRVERIVNERAGGRLGEESVFWDIEQHLPSETRDYVPLMLAMGHIGKNPTKYAFDDVQLQKPYSYKEVSVPGGVPLDRVAQDAGVPAQVVYDLNPHLIKKQTPPGREWQVRIPVDAEDTNLAGKVSDAIRWG
jgi:peptidoglycan lytic transglycosylase D